MSYIDNSLFNMTGNKAGMSFIKVDDLVGYNREGSRRDYWFGAYYYAGYVRNDCALAPWYDVNCGVYAGIMGILTDSSWGGGQSGYWDGSRIYRLFVSIRLF